MSKVNESMRQFMEASGGNNLQGVESGMNQKLVAKFEEKLVAKMREHVFLNWPISVAEDEEKAVAERVARYAVQLLNPNPTPKGDSSG